MRDLCFKLRYQIRYLNELFTQTRLLIKIEHLIMKMLNC